VTGKSKCPQCGGPGNHPIGSSACKRIEIQRGDKSKILMPETPCTICGDYVAWPANDDSSHCICTECIYTEHAALRQRVVALEAEVEKLRAALS